jgi:O-antigen/teichoic acid export membrane protein
MQTIRNMSTQKRTIKPIAEVGITATISQVLVMVQTMLLARYLGPATYATVAASLAICALSSIFMDMGLDTWLLHKGSVTENRQSTAGSILMLKLLLGLVWGSILFNFAPLIRPSIYLRPVLVLSILAVFIDALSRTGYMLFFLTNRFRESSLILLVSRIIRVLGTILLIALNTQDPSDYLLLRVVIDLIFLVIILVRVKIEFVKNILASLIPVYKHALPYGFSEVLNTVYNQSDVNLVSLFSSNLQAISFFSVAINIVNAFFAVVQTIQNVIIPKLTITFEKNRTRFNDISKQVIIGFFIIGTITWIGLPILGSNLIIKMLGEQYSNAFNVLKNLSGIFIVRSLIIALTSILIATNNQKRRLIPQIIAVLAKIAIGIFVISRFGVESLPIPYVFSELTLLAALGFTCFKWIWTTKPNDGDAA